MSIFTTTRINKEEPKVHHSQYIRTENMADDASPKPTEPAKPAQSEAK